MAAVAFPSGYDLERDTTFEYHTNTKTDITDDGEVLQRTTNDQVYVTVGAVFRYLTAAEKDTLKDFIDDNKGNIVGWVIDGAPLVGYIKGGYRITMTGNRFNMTFTFYGAEVVL